MLLPLPYGRGGRQLESQRIPGNPSRLVRPSVSPIDWACDAKPLRQRALRRLRALPFQDIAGISPRCPHKAVPVCTIDPVTRAQPGSPLSTPTAFHSMLHGTISHGTLRPQDLIPAFLDALRTVNPAAYDQLTLGSGHSPIPSYALEDEDAEWWSGEAQWLLMDLVSCLGDSAPEGTYFGTLEGDGSDFGFWPLESEEA